MSAYLSLLLDAALRAAALGLLVALLLKLTRLRDPRAEISIWTTVLLAALTMPLLHMELPNWLAVPLPHFSFDHAIVTHGMGNTPGPAVALMDKGHGLALVPGQPASYSGLWFLLQRGTQWLWPAYIFAVAVQIGRLAMGLVLTLRLYRSATPVLANWTAGRLIRASEQVTGPVTLGRCIVLPADYGSWPHKKLLAVLAHEESHIARGDFFIQLLANLHRAVFWFSPFAWWLQAKLCALAEAASDEAAVERLDDRASYAEILVEVSQRAHGAPVQIAMAKGPDIHWRVDRILSERQGRRLGVLARIATVAAIVPAALIVAGANAAVPLAHPRLPRLLPIPMAVPILAETGKDIVAPMPPAPKPSPSRRAKPAPAAADEPDVTYNPRALLDEPSVAILPAVLPVSDGRSSKGKQENAVILLGGAVLPDH